MKYTKTKAVLNQLVADLSQMSMTSDALVHAWTQLFEVAPLDG